MFNSLKPKTLVALFAIMALLLVTALACGSSATPVPQVIEVTKEVEVIKEVEVVRQVLVTPVPAAKETIIFSDLNWSSVELQTRIAQYIVEHGYGYPVDAIFGDTISMQVGLSEGDTHVSMEIWLPNQQAWWDKELKDGSVIPVGKSLDDNWQSAFVVPTYVVEDNPGLKSVFDLPDYMDLFVTPESNGKALLVGCLVGWACEIDNEAQVKAYGLEDVIELQNPGAQAALDAHIMGAYEKGEPALFYYWGPTKIAAELDLTRLEQPAYTDACWEAGQGLRLFIGPGSHRRPSESYSASARRSRDAAQMGLHCRGTGGGGELDVRERGDF